MSAQSSNSIVNLAGLIEQQSGRYLSELGAFREKLEVIYHLHSIAIVSDQKNDIIIIIITCMFSRPKTQMIPKAAISYPRSRLLNLYGYCVCE